MMSNSEAEQLIYGKHVAVVGNAPEILDLEYADLIDGCDVVLRMNRGFPTTARQRRAIGKRTDILTGGVVHPLDSLPDDLQAIFWFKHTKLGDAHMGEILTATTIPVWHIPRVWLKPLEEEFQCGASSAPVAVHACTKLGASKISLFGVGCWGIFDGQTKDHWWRSSHQPKMPAKGWHNDAAEARWISERFRRVEPFYWEAIW